METFYYDAIYNILQETTIRESTSRMLKTLKANIVGLHHIEQQRILLDTDEQGRIAGEGQSLYHILKSRKRQEARVIHCIHDSYGNPKTISTDILCTFTEFVRRKYSNGGRLCTTHCEHLEEDANPRCEYRLGCTHRNGRTSSRYKKRETTQSTRR
jgi:hypothetical protein